MSSAKFTDHVYALTRLIPQGKVATYSSLARALGNSGAARAVGNALNKNPDAPRTPCHRVVRANGQVGDFASGSAKKIKLLKKEGVIVWQGKVDLEKYFYEFKNKKQGC